MYPTSAIVVQKVTSREQCCNNTPSMQCYSAFDSRGTYGLELLLYIATVLGWVVLGDASLLKLASLGTSDLHETCDVFKTV